MMKGLTLATLAVFAAGAVLDFVIHSVILSPLYASSSELWRSMEEMRYDVMYIASFIFALTFAYLYTRFVGEKSVKNGTLFGLVLGVGMGVLSGYGTYAFMPISYELALGWFLGTVVEFTVFGLLVGLIVKKS